MLQSILVYGFMMLSTYLVGKSYIKSDPKATAIFIILVFVFFSAFRDGVGVDYFSYKSGYEYIHKYLTNYRQDSEIGFVFLMYILAYLDCHFSIFFGAIALIQIYFLLKALRNAKMIYPSLILFMVACAEYLNWMNGMRQFIALPIVLYAMSLDKLSKKIALCVIATLFHSSAILLLPFVLLCHYRPNIWIKRIDTKIFLILLFQLLPNFVHIEGYFSFVESIMKFIGYERYSDSSVLMSDEKYALNIGPRYFILLTVGIIMTIFSSKLQKKFTGTLFPSLYNLYFIGLLITPIFRSSLHMMRFASYFNSLIFVLCAFLFTYFEDMKKSSGTKWIFLIFVSLYMIITLQTVSPNDNFFYYKFIFNV